MIGKMGQGPIAKEINDGILEHQQGKKVEEEIPRINTKEEMFELLRNPLYSHNRSSDGLDIRKQPGEEGTFVLTTGIGSGFIKSNATEEQIKQWYDDFYKEVK